MILCSTAALPWGEFLPMILEILAPERHRESFMRSPHLASVDCSVDLCERELAAILSAELCEVGRVHFGKGLRCCLFRGKKRKVCRRPRSARLPIPVSCESSWLDRSSGSTTDTLPILSRLMTWCYFVMHKIVPARLLNRFGNRLPYKWDTYAPGAFFVDPPQAYPAPSVYSIATPSLSKLVLVRSCCVTGRVVGLEGYTKNPRGVTRPSTSPCP